MKRLVSLSIIISLIIIIIFFLSFLAKVNKVSQLNQPTQPADVALILGTKVFVNGQVNQCLIARLQKGVTLLKQHQVKALIMTGGRDNINQPTEAQVMASLARYKGVLANVVWTENNSSDTWENIAFSQKLIKRKSWQKVIIVSEPYHLPRALMIAKYFGLKARGVAVTSSPCWQNLKSKLLFLGRDFLAYIQDNWRIISQPQSPRI